MALLSSRIIITRVIRVQHYLAVRDSLRCRLLNDQTTDIDLFRNLNGIQFINSPMQVASVTRIAYTISKTSITREQLPDVLCITRRNITITGQ